MNEQEIPMDTPQDLDPVNQYIFKEHLRNLVADERARRDVGLRLQLVLLIPDVGELLLTHAAQLNLARDGESDAFSEDDTAAELLWLLLEFLTQSKINRFDTDSIYESALLPFQLDARHARDFFDIDLLADGELVARKTGTA